MDRTLTVVLAVLAVAAAIFLVVFSLTVYMGITYRDTLTSTYDYRMNIASDTGIGNVTLYIPVPGRLSGNSAVLEEIGESRLTGLPAGWVVTLLGTEKVNFLELTAREIPASPPGSPYLLSLRIQVKGPIGTESDGLNGLVLAPLAAKEPVACPAMAGDQVSGQTECRAYQGTAYADFTGPPGANLRFSLSLTGRNSWDVFGPSSNSYRDDLQMSFSGDERGWKKGDGLLVTGLGDYGMNIWVGWAAEPADPSGPQIRLVPAAGGPAA